MGFDINKFTAELNKSGMARSSDFECVIDTKSILGLNEVSSSLQFRLESTSLPMRSVQPIDYKDYGYPYKIGGMANTVEIEMVIICSEDLRERDFFMSWQDLIVGKHRKKEIGNNEATRKNMFDVGYYDDYVCKQGVSIYQLDPSGFRTYAVDLIDAYPMNVQPLSLSWGQTEIQKMNVTMTFRYFEERNEDLGGQTAQVTEKFGGRPAKHISLQQLLNPQKFLKGEGMRMLRSQASKLKKSGLDINF
jgi:hypothetical protein|tara:strand:- start:573 stop:1316 length:744 start_codon:yes stop_codon:yes gene_type:complete